MAVQADNTVSSLNTVSSATEGPAATVPSPPWDPCCGCCKCDAPPEKRLKRSIITWILVLWTLVVALPFIFCLLINMAFGHTWGTKFHFNALAILVMGNGANIAGFLAYFLVYPIAVITLTIAACRCVDPYNRILLTRISEWVLFPLFALLTLVALILGQITDDESNGSEQGFAERIIIRLSCVVVNSLIALLVLFLGRANIYCVKQEQTIINEAI